MPYPSYVSLREQDCPFPYSTHPVGIALSPGQLTFPGLRSPRSTHLAGTALALCPLTQPLLVHSPSHDCSLPCSTHPASPLLHSPSHDCSLP